MGVEKELRARILRVKRLLQERHEEPSAIIVSSAPRPNRSHDTDFPYRQNSDFFYLTGSFEKDQTLLITSGKEPATLFSKPIDSHTVLWEGAPENSEERAESLGVELVLTDSPIVEVIEKLKGTHVLYYQSIEGSLSLSVASRLLPIRPHRRKQLPSTFITSDEILPKLRLYKSPQELELIRKAISITEVALREAAPSISPGIKESFIKSTVDYWFRVNDCEPGFNTIVASGPSAAVLHYEKANREIKREDLLLIDCGAEHNCYSADVTRVYPASGTFSEIHRDLYTIVLDAQRAAIRRVKHGAKVAAVYNAAARVLTEGLVDLKVLKGRVSKLVDTKAYKPYFPHGIGHSLGMDVHDVGGFHNNNEAVLEEGMIMTIEPGLYFPKKVGKIHPLGIRIEDDVLVTKKGFEVLTERIPKDPSEVQGIMVS